MTPRPLVLACLLAAVLPGCVPDNLTDFDFKARQPPLPPPEATGDRLVGTAPAGPFGVELWADRGGAHLGYNRLGFRLTRAGQPVADARLQVVVEALDGPAAGVAMPATDPAARADEGGFFRGDAFFLAPDTAAQRFALGVTVEGLDGATGTARFEVEARADRWMQRLDGWLVSWVAPARPVVGRNLFEVAAHAWTGHDFAPAPGLAADLYPYMDMGGGDGHSTPFTPAAMEAGRYRWNVDFIMSGAWRMTVFLTPPGGPRQAFHFRDFTVFEP